MSALKSLRQLDVKLTAYRMRRIEEGDKLVDANGDEFVVRLFTERAVFIRPKKDDATHFELDEEVWADIKPKDGPLPIPE